MPQPPLWGARIKEILVMAGDQVSKDQPLGSIEAPEYAEQLQSAANELANLRAIAGLPQINNPDDSAGLVEKEAASKLAQARFDEERFYKLYQDAVNDHVRSQVTLRSISSINSPEYNSARANETSLRQRMQEALENFEKASKFRSSLDQALTKIRYAIMKARKSAGLAAINEKSPNSEATFSGVNTLVSPAQGSVFRIDGTPGQIIQPGQTVFYILPFQEKNGGDRWIQAWFLPSERENIKAGQPVSIRFPDTGMHLSGTVELVAPDNQQLPEIMASDKIKTAPLSQPEGNYLSESYVPVKISIKDSEKTNDLKPGSRAECQIQTHYIFGLDWL